MIDVISITMHKLLGGFREHIGNIEKSLALCDKLARTWMNDQLKFTYLYQRSDFIFHTRLIHEFLVVIDKIYIIAH